MPDFATLMLFITFALTLAIVLTLIVLIPWMRASSGVDNRLLDINIDVYKDRLNELQADYQAGVMDETNFVNQKTELERQLLQASQEVSGKTFIVSRKSRFIVLLWIPALMAMGYVLASDRTPVFDLWKAQDTVGQVADDLLTGKIDVPPEWATKDSVALISAMQTNVYQHAHDPDRWMRLSELFLALNANEQAIESLSRAYRLAPDNESIATTYAQVSFFANGGILDSESRKALQRVLTANPNHQGAQMLMAMGEARAGNTEVAQAWVDKLRANIAARPGDHSAALDSLDKLSQTISEQQAAAKQGLTINVTVNPSLLPLIEANDVLFVSARDVNGGPPYAAKRIAVNELQQGQLQVTLSNNDAMMPGRDIKSAQAQNIKLEVNARISHSGQALPESGDLAASPIALQGDEEQINIEINQQLP